MARRTRHSSLLALAAAVACAAACSACDATKDRPAPTIAAAAPAAIDAPDAAPEESEDPDPPIEARTVDVPGDLPVFFVEGRRGTHGTSVFFHPACTHGLGYIQAFANAASARGAVLALQGEHHCGEGLRSWHLDPDRLDARVRAGLAAAGRAESGPITAIGYSQGALVVEGLAAKFPERYRTAILIGAPRVPDARPLSRLDAAVMMAGTYDNRAVMEEGAKRLVRIGVPATFLEIPRARHGQILEAERVMDDAFTWLEAHRAGARDAAPAP
jgi:pimeloyl-ACP methyl ester carboxylesterase